MKTNKPAHEITALFALSKLIRLDVWFLVSPFTYFHTSCERTAKALARLRGCAGSPEPSLVANLVSTTGSNAVNFWSYTLVLQKVDLKFSVGNIITIPFWSWIWIEFEKKTSNFQEKITLHKKNMNKIDLTLTLLTDLNVSLPILVSLQGLQGANEGTAAIVK